ncbi:MAG: transcriptional regulator [Deltaproteobacteria bacterium]|nr:transcriptional regulator [Deltaproteobacteria bacterium]
MPKSKAVPSSSVPSSSAPHRLTHASRVLRIHELLNTRPYVTIKQLQETFGVSRKTVYNDLAALQAAHIPIQNLQRPGEEARWMLAPEAKRHQLTLGKGQVLPFGLALNALSFLAGTEIHEQLEKILGKLMEGATPQTKKQIGTLSRKALVVPFGPKLYGAKAEILDDIMTALLYDRQIEILYRPPWAKRARRHLIEPLSLALHREALYLIADAPKSGHRITFAVDRIIQTNERKETFPYPDDYDPDTSFSQAFGVIDGEEEHVSIVFDGNQAAYITERQWHPTQRFETLADGRVRMTMTVSGTFEVLLWLVGHSGTFEVEAPAKLRKLVRKSLARGLRRHKGRGKSAKNAKKSG